MSAERRPERANMTVVVGARLVSREGVKRELRHQRRLQVSYNEPVISSETMWARHRREWYRSGEAGQRGRRMQDIDRKNAAQVGRLRL